MGSDRYGHRFFASELKALEGKCDVIEPFLPGHVYDSATGESRQWYHRDWTEYDNVKDNTTSIDALRDALEASVKRQLMSDVPYGVLLSGGLDSSIISAIAAKYAAHRIESNDKQAAWWPRLPLICRWAQRGARPKGRPENGRTPRHGASRNQLYNPGGA